MADINTVLNDPWWVPHHFDANQDAVLFAKIDSDERAKLAFLADFKPADDSQTQWIPAAAVQNVPPSSRPVHFLFHSAFCRSTLLVKALGALPSVGGLSEPAILNNLQSQAKLPKARGMLAPLLNQLSKAIDNESAVIAKPSNFANGLIPAFMDHASGINAVLLYGSLPAFLLSVAKKGLGGRLWARKQLAHSRTIMPLDLGMDEKAHYELSDLQCAALAWLLQMRQFAELIKARPDAFRTLESDHFIANKAAALVACGRWYGLEVALDDAKAVANGALFQSHAKQGGDYEAVKAKQDAAGTSQVTEEEIEQIEQWIAVIMKQLGLTLPLANPLEIGGA